jgi:hypothetical protein
MTTMGVEAREAGVANLWIYAWHGDLEQPSLNFDDFNPDCYNALSDIVAAWVAVGHVSSGRGRLLGFQRNRLVRVD